MGILNLDTIESVIHDLDIHAPAVETTPQRYLINFEQAFDTSGMKVPPDRFSIRIPKNAVSGEQLSILFRRMREIFKPEDRCLLQNAGDAGVLIEASAEMKHKALIVLWELGIYHFRFTYTYDLARKGA